MASFTTTTSTTWAVPSNAVPGSVQVYAKGESGTGGTSAHGSHSGAGSGAGAFAGEPALGGLTPGVTVLTITVPQGATGNPTTVTGGSVTVSAAAGTSASGATPGNGGAAGSNTIAEAGGSGAAGTTGSSEGGGGGGGSGGSTGAGGNGTAGNTSGGGAGGTAGTGAAGPPSLAGVAGAAGGSNLSTGTAGTAPGGGASGGGCGAGSNQAGGAAAAGQVVIIWSVITISPAGYAAFTGTAATSKKATTAVKGYAAFAGTPPRINVVNQWSGTFAQPASFGTTPPALQSTVIALTPASAVGSGTGYPSAGNWLVCVAGWNQDGTPPATVGDADDIHGFWRPGDVWTSQWAVSPSAGNTRTSVWYTANLARQPGDVYCAPSGVMAGRACTVLEIAGLGPWDVITGIGTAHAAAAMSLGLSLPAPSAASFTLAAVTGDSSAAGQSFAPSGWVPLVTTTASDGSDHTCDAVLQCAYLASTTGSVSVSASASSDTDLSGVIIGFQIQAPSPVPAGANPAWAGRFVMEAAFNAGFQTPQDQRQWTVLTDNAWLPGQAIKRLWGFSDQSGVPYMLGQLQSGTGTIPLDNFDGALSPARVAASGPWSFAVTGTPSTSKYFTVTTAQAASISTGQAFTDSSNPGTLFVVQSVGTPSGGDVNVSFLPAATTVMSSGDTVTQVNPVTGIPVRLRCALGTITTREGSVTYNRWYVLERNALNWPEKRNKALRNFVPLATTDIWSVMSGSCPTPYRGEVEQDNPSDWWPADDQPGTGGVLPTSLRNAATGSTTLLDIVLSPNGGQLQSQVTIAGGTIAPSTAQPGLIATYNVAQNQGWMPGDPQSSPQSSQSGNPVTAQPGSASWAQTGVAGSSGSYAFFLSANSASFPAVASGVTVEAWFNYPFWGTSAVATAGTTAPVAGQPDCPLTIAALYGNSEPVAILQLDTSGHMSLITYSGGSGTSHSVYTGSDLRNGMFNQAVIELTATSWQVYVNGGLTAAASGSATVNTAYTYQLFGGDVGSGGGGSTGSIAHCGNGAFSHMKVYPSLLPAYRVHTHYAAAICGFGLIPAPSSPQASFAASSTQATPDGSLMGSAAGTPGTVPITAVCAAVAGSYTSGPSAWVAQATFGASMPGWAGATVLAPLMKIYTASQIGSEREASAVCGTGDAYSAPLGYGSGASGSGFCHVSGGTGASPPTAASAFGDTVAQRIERIAGYAGITYPGRAVDATADLLVQAAGDIGGQAPGASLQSLVNSDDGLMYVAADATIRYRSRPHLASDTTVWYIGTDVAAGMIPFLGDIVYPNDSQRIYTDITVTPYSPDGIALPIITPSDGAAVDAAQAQYGPKPYAVTSYLQSATEQQSQADNLFSTYSVPQRRIQFTVNAASHPAAWAFVLGASISDICQVFDQPIGAPSTTGNFRITRIERSLAYGANDSQVEATAVVTADPVLTYWS